MDPFALLIFGLLAVTPALIGAFLGAGLTLRAGSPLYEILHGHGLPAEYQNFMLAIWAGVSLFLGYLGSMRIFLFFGFLIWPLLLLALIIGYIVGFVFPDLIMQHAGMSLALDLLFSLAFLIFWIGGKIILSDRAMNHAFLTANLFYFGSPPFLTMACVGAKVHADGSSPLYKELAEHGVPGKYHAAVLVTVLLVPVVTGSFFVKMGKYFKLGTKQVLYFIAAGALAGYAVGSLMGDMFRYHFGWVVLTYLVMSVLLLASFVDQWLA